MLSYQHLFTSKIFRLQLEPFSIYETKCFTFYILQKFPFFSKYAIIFQWFPGEFQGVNSISGFRGRLRVPGKWPPWFYIQRPRSLHMRYFKFACKRKVYCHTKTYLTSRSDSRIYLRVLHVTQN